MQADSGDDTAKRVLRKIDWRLLPLMFITYNFNFMDKTILSSASVFHLREDTVSLPMLFSASYLTDQLRTSWDNSTRGLAPCFISATSSGSILPRYSSPAFL